MGTSTIYQFPWPELPDPADGPDGFSDLADSFDAKMTRWRSDLNVGATSDGWQLTPGTTAEFWKTTVNVGKGWVEIDFNAQFFGQGGCVAGVVNARIDGTIARSWSFHNDCKGSNIEMPISGSVAQDFPSGKNDVPLSLSVDIASNGSPIIIVTASVITRQFGAG